MFVLALELDFIEINPDIFLKIRYTMAFLCQNVCLFVCCWFFFFFFFFFVVGFFLYRHCPPRCRVRLLAATLSHCVAAMFP